MGTEEDKRAKVIAIGGIEVICRSLAAHPSTGGVQEAGLAALCAVATTDETRQATARSGATLLACQVRCAFPSLRAAVQPRQKAGPWARTRPLQ